MDAIDLTKDPYFLKNHLGTFECRLCLTLHANEGNYLAHTQGKKHQSNLARRIARESRDASLATKRQEIARKAVKARPFCLGRPTYRLSKSRRDGARQLLLEVDFPEIEEECQPEFRIISCYEQRVEYPDRNYMYLLVAADPYSTIGFKVPNLELDRGESRFFDSWDQERRLYTVCLTFKTA
jgi:splicing factor 3A subunit 2